MGEIKIVCPECNSDDTWKYGRLITRGGKKQKYQCKDCGFSFTTNEFISIHPKLKKGKTKCLK